VGEGGAALAGPGEEGWGWLGGGGGGLIAYAGMHLFRAIYVWPLPSP
jgi:hypothetical protein